MGAPDTFAKFRDLPDQRKFVLNTSPATLVSPLTIQGTNPILIFDDTNNENFRLSVDTDILSIINDTGPITFIRFRGGANDDIQIDRPVTFNSTVSGLTFTDITLSDASPTITFDDTDNENFTISADSDILSIINTTGPITYIRFRGAANDDIQVDRPLIVNADLTLSDASPTITFTDTTAGDDDYTIAVDADLMTITNLTTTANLQIGSTGVLLRLTTNGAAEQGIIIDLVNATSSGISAMQVIGGSGNSRLFIRQSGEVISSAGYPTNEVDVPAELIVLGGDYDQDGSATGNVGTGVDTLRTNNIIGNVLANDGDNLQGRYGGLFADNANNKHLIASFGGTNFFDTGAVAFQNGGWTLSYDIVRRSSSSVVVNWLFTVNAASGNLAYGRATVITGLTLSNNNTLLLTGEATSNNDVTCEASTIRKFGRAQ